MTLAGQDFDLGPGLTIVPPSRSKQQKLYKSFPSGAEGTVYDLVFVREVMQWKNWLKTVESRLTLLGQTSVQKFCNKSIH